MKVAALFDPEPARWGLRGDPHLWRAMKEHLADVDLPSARSEVTSVLEAAFRDLTGADLARDPASWVTREQYAHGGLSSGMISLDTWRDSLMPLLVARAGELASP